MKRIFTALLAVAIIFNLAGCSKAVSNAQIEGIDAPVDILNDVWDIYKDDQKFWALGGDLNNIVNEAPGAFNIKDTQALAFNLLCKDEAAGMIDSAASLIHALNANLFTAAAYHLKDKNDVSQFAQKMQENILNNRWIDGFPDKLFIATVGDFVVVVFGVSEIADTFKTNLMAVFDTACIIAEKPIK